MRSQLVHETGVSPSCKAWSNEASATKGPEFYVTNDGSTGLVDCNRYSLPKSRALLRADFVAIP